MSTLEVNKITPSTGTSITLGDSGDTFTIPSGVTITNNGTQTGFGGNNTPAFEATMSASQSITDSVWTLIQFNTEVFDTDNCYDTSNYRFTPNEAGYYFLHSEVVGDTLASTHYEASGININKNGSEIFMNSSDFNASLPRKIPMSISCVAYANGTSDYFTSSSYVNDASGNATIDNNSQRQCRFLGFKLIGV